jgi:hypothetical protein
MMCTASTPPPMVDRYGSWIDIAKHVKDVKPNKFNYCGDPKTGKAP